MDNEKQHEDITIEDLNSVPGGEALNAEQMQGVKGGGLASSPLGSTFVKLDSSTALTGNLTPSTDRYVKF